MKVILKQDVDNLGDKGDIKEVKSGYARNFLIPRGLAVIADKSGLRSLEEEKKVLARKEKRLEEKLRSMSDRIAKAVVEITANVGAEGKLYGSVTPAQIAEILKEKLQLDIDRRRVVIDTPIKTVGDHTVNVRLSGEQEVAVKVIVTGIVDPAVKAAEEKAALEKAAAEEREAAEKAAEAEEEEAEAGEEAGEAEDDAEAAE